MITFIATDTDRSAIYGLGATESAAITDAISQCGALTNLIAVECSAELATEVKARGGAISWNEIDGVAVTDGERTH